ncbi:MAG: PAS domain S-box protein, partial [Deltaproteobacteria bacterium]|nr:PAS domain S-box protein [Deltaproteobacteria bacterium]
RSAEAKSRLILQTMPSGLFTVDLQKKITSWNKEAEEITGLTADEVIGKDCLDVLDCDACRKGCDLLDDTVDKPLYGKECVIHVEGKAATIAKNLDLLKDLHGRTIGGLESFVDISDRKRAEEEREKLIKELKDALREVKTLSGLLPICASCKKIRDDKCYWNQIESYIRDHSEAEFSHSLCPECLKKLYPELDRR